MRRKRKQKHKSSEVIMLCICIACMIISIFCVTKRKGDIRYLSFDVSDDENTERSCTDAEADGMSVALFPLSDEAKPEDDAKEVSRSINLSFSQREKPVVLIYHTHTLESYTATEKYPYKETDGRWRTNDKSRSIVAVGDKLAQELEKCGFTVIHDTTDHEPPKLSTAYERSLVTMEKYRDKYPIDIYIDLHRDASDESNTRDYCVINGEQTARVMFVVGHGTRYDVKPDFEKNYAAAEAVTQYLRSINPKLARDIREKPGRYNQHVGGICLLIEIGHNMNTLEQALASTKYVAEGIGEMFFRQ